MHGDDHARESGHRVRRAPALHGHGPGVTDRSLVSARRGLRALAWSCAALTATALLQAIVVALSGSVALLADTIHNLADAATAVPLGIAFLLARRRATAQLAYGLGRAEDLAGLAIVLTIAASAGLAVWQAVERLLYPRPVEHLGAVALAAVVGFAGNEAVAIYRIRVGRLIGSVALVADGHHARVDAWTSLSVLLGALGVWAGVPAADPLVGLGIAAAIFVLVWQAGRAVVLRVLDGVEPGTLETVGQTASRAPQVEGITDVRARWVGHRLHVELSITVAADLTVAQGHAIAREVRHRLLHRLAHVGDVRVHVDPSGEGGEQHHRIGQHAHDGLPVHTHD